MSPPVPVPPLARRLAGVPSSIIRDVLHHAQQPGMLSLAGGMPDLSLLDLAGLADATHRVVARAPARALQYGSSEGQPALREQLARLMQERGATVPAERILVTAGSQQALDLVARALLDPGDRVAVEHPCYLAALQVFALAEANILPLPADPTGVGLDALLAGRHGRPKLVYLVPTFGNPGGAVLDRERRLALLVWAAREGVYLLEDDPYGELRYEGEPMPSLLALAASVPGAEERVIHVSTLSKLMAPGLRIGWLVVPPALLPALLRVKQTLDLQTGTLAQEITAEWLAAGHLAPTLERLRDGYCQRRDALLAALAGELADELDYATPAGGMFVWARFRDDRDTARLLPQAITAGVLYVPGQAFSAGPPLHGHLRLGFASLAPERYGEAMQRLRRACRPTAGVPAPF